MGAGRCSWRLCKRRLPYTGGPEGTARAKETAIRLLLENVLHGYDVVPAAVHLTAATLSMAETRQLIGPMPLFWMPHDVHERRARLGSLDFLENSPSRGIAQKLPAFVDTEHDPGRVTGTGERVYDAQMPGECDLVIANPPYTRAGGPGASDHTDWNPIFGSAPSAKPMLGLCRTPSSGH